MASNVFLRQYLQEIACHPMLNTEDERTLAILIWNSRERLRRKLLATDYILRAVCRLGKKVCAREDRLDRLVELDCRDPQQKVRARETLPKTLAAITKVLRRNRRDWKVFSDRKQPAEDRRRARRQIARRRKHAGQLLASSGIRLERLEEAVLRLRRILERMKQIQTQLSARSTLPDRGLSVRGKRRMLRRLMRLTGETAATLQARISTIENRQSQYAGARKRLVESNLRMVVPIARYYRRFGGTLLDLIQEGNLGLMRAAEKYDYRRETRFSTCATWWIRQAIGRTLPKATRTIRLPAGAFLRMTGIQRKMDRLEQTKGMKVHAEDPAAALAYPTDKAVRLLAAAPPPLSLDGRSPDDGSNLADILFDHHQDNPQRALDDQRLREVLHHALDSLPAQERAVIHMRYGLLDGRARSLQEIGTELHLTRERIRQIARNALSKLRQPGQTRRLEGFLDPPPAQLQTALRLESLNRAQPYASDAVATGEFRTDAHGTLYQEPSRPRQTIAG